MAGWAGNACLGGPLSVLGWGRLPAPQTVSSQRSTGWDYTAIHLIAIVLGAKRQYFCPLRMFGHAQRQPPAACRPGWLCPAAHTAWTASALAPHRECVEAALPHPALFGAACWQHRETHSLLEASSRSVPHHQHRASPALIPTLGTTFQQSAKKLQCHSGLSL